MILTYENSIVEIPGMFIPGVICGAKAQIELKSTVL